MEQIILQTIGDMWIILASGVAISSLFITIKEWK